jgi:hypothetical protein
MNPGVPGHGKTPADTEPLMVAHLHRSLLLSMSANLPTITQHREIQKESCYKHMARAECTKHNWTQNLCLAPACVTLYLICSQQSKSANPPGEHNTLFGGQPHIQLHLGRWLQSLWAKLVAKYGVNISPLSGVEEQNVELKKKPCVCGGATQQPQSVKLGTALPCSNWEQAKTDSFIKRKAYF